MVGTLLWVVNVVGGVGSGEGAEGRWAVSRRSAGGGAVVRERCGWGRSAGGGSGGGGGGGGGKGGGGGEGECGGGCG